MSVAKVTEITEQNVVIDNGKITGFRVDLKVTFILE